MKSWKHSLCPFKTIFCLSNSENIWHTIVYYTKVLRIQIKVSRNQWRSVISSLHYTISLFVVHIELNLCLITSLCYITPSSLNFRSGTHEPYLPVLFNKNLLWIIRINMEKVLCTRCTVGHLNVLFMTLT